MIWRYDTDLGIRASCTAAMPTITTGGAGDGWTNDGEPDHLCPVALLAMGDEAETAEHLERVRTIHDNAVERVPTRSGEVVTTTRRQNSTRRGSRTADPLPADGPIRALGHQPVGSRRPCVAARSYRDPSMTRTWPAAAYSRIARSAVMSGPLQ